MLKSHPLLLVVAFSVACGGSFQASSGGGGSGAGGDGQAGSPRTSGGQPSSAGGESGGSAGGLEVGGAIGSAGGSTTGAGGSTTGAGGSTTGAGGSTTGAGGSTTGAGGGSAGGASGGADCVTLKAEYSAAVQKARVCDQGSTNECDKSSTLPAIGCGCPVLVNAKSTFTASAQQKYQAIQDAKCNNGPTCAIACLAYASATCAAPVAGGSAFVCTATSSPVN